MQLELSKDELKTLLEMIYLADWVLDAHETEKNPRTNAQRALAQKIMAQAFFLGLTDWVEYSEELKGYFPTRKLEEWIERNRYLTDYDNDTFWSELIERLAQRDFARQEGAETIRHMSIEEHFAKFQPFEDLYASEFEQHGIEHLHI
jgi:hypothetical protein